MSDGASTSVRLRALSFGLSLGLFALFAALLMISSRTLAPYEHAARGVDVIMIPREAETPQTAQRRRAPQGRPSPTIPDANSEAANRAALAQMLACLRPRTQRPSWCPRETSAEAPRTELPVGGDFHQPPRIDRERIYTRAELATLVMPPCEAGCVAIGPPPPPPSRSAEQVCEDANLGGPCRPPPFREEDVVRQRHSD